MRLNTAGRMVQSVWEGISANYPNVSLDAYVLMPDHFHGLVVITDCVGAIHESPIAVASNIRAIHESPLQNRFVNRNY